MNGKDRVDGMTGAVTRWEYMSPSDAVSISRKNAEQMLEFAKTDILALWKAYVDASFEIEKLREENARLRNVLKPFAKAGELFSVIPEGGTDQRIYNPAAGDAWSISGNDLRAARDELK